MQSRFLPLLLALGVCFFCSPAFAAPQSPQPRADTPRKLDVRQTPICVVIEGSDSIGARLGMKLKEGFNASNLFKLAEKDKPKIRLLLSTKPEFPSRPSLGSVYSICWVFSQGEGYLSFLLGRDYGTIEPDGVDALVAKILERSDGLSVKYGDLLKDSKEAKN